MHKNILGKERMRNFFGLREEIMVAPLWASIRKSQWSMKRQGSQLECRQNAGG